MQHFTAFIEKFRREGGFNNEKDEEGHKIIKATGSKNTFHENVVLRSNRRRERGLLCKPKFNTNILLNLVGVNYDDNSGCSLDKAKVGVVSESQKSTANRQGVGISGAANTNHHPNRKTLKSNKKRNKIVDVIQPSKNGKSSTSEVLVVSPYFQQSRANRDGDSQGKVATFKEVVVSPYFQESEANQGGVVISANAEDTDKKRKQFDLETHNVDDASSNRIDGDNQSSKKRKRGKSKLVAVSPYFQNVDAGAQAKVAISASANADRPDQKVKQSNRKTPDVDDVGLKEIVGDNQSSENTSKENSKLLVVSSYFQHCNSNQDGKDAQVKDASRAGANADQPLQTRKQANRETYVDCIGPNELVGDSQSSAKRKRGKSKVVVVSPYFQNPNAIADGVAQVKVAIGASANVAHPKQKIKQPVHEIPDIVDDVRTNDIIGDNQPYENREKGNSKEVVVSPYFQNSNENRDGGAQVKVAFRIDANADHPKRKRKQPKHKTPDVECITSNKIVDDNQPSKKRKKGKSEVVVVSPYFQNSDANQDSGNQDILAASVCTGANGSKRKTKRRNVKTCTEEQSVAHKTVGKPFSNQLIEAYKRKSVDNAWIPPITRHGLIQEDFYEDPWKILVICMLLNRTTGAQATKVIGDLFELCPNAQAATKVETEKIEEVIRPLGLQKKRSRMIQKFSEEYLGDDWTHVTQLHGIGKYAADAYAIFCTGHWMDVFPEDHKLYAYWNFLRGSEE